MPFSTISPFSQGANPPVSPSGFFSYDKNSTTSTSITQNISNTKEGHLLVAIIASDTGGAGSGVAITSVPAGWTFAGGTGNTTSNDHCLRYYYKTADATDAAGTTYTWTISGTKSVNDSVIITIGFLNAQMMTLASGTPTRPSADGVGHNIGTFSYTRTCQGSMILGIMSDSQPSSITEAFATATSGNYWNFYWGDGAGTSGTGLYIFTAQYSSLNNLPRVADPTTSDTVSMGFTTTAGVSNEWFSFIEIIPASYIQPVSPFFSGGSDATATGVTDLTNVSMSRATSVVNTYPYTGTMPSSYAPGDLLMSIFVLDSVSNIAAIDPDGSWSKIFSSGAATCPFVCATKTATGSDSITWTVSMTTGGTSSRNYSGYVVTIAFSSTNGVLLDSFGTLVTGTTGASVRPLGSATINYETAFAILVSGSNGNWVMATGGTMTEATNITKQSHQPGFEIFYQRNIGSGAYDPGAVFQSGTGGSGATEGVIFTLRNP